MGLVLLALAFRPLPAAPAPAATGLAITRVYTGWRAAASFKRISEYFDGRENTGGETILRTHPDQRTGYYFLVRLANPGPALPVKLGVLVVTGNGADNRLFPFATELKTGDTVVELGLTGPDWLDPKATPIAWKLDVTTADGHPLASEKSYLWERPATKP